MLLKLHYFVGWALLFATLSMMAFYVPEKEQTLGQSYLIFFYHFPSALGCLLLFFLSGVYCVVHLATGTTDSDHQALAFVEVGILACTVTLVTGSIWAKAAWGRFWIWHDPRLMTVAIMWFTYLGYLALRAAIDSAAQRARYSAIFGIIAAVNIPLVWFSIQWWGRVSHPAPGVKFEPAMRYTQWFGFLAFMVLYFAFWRSRTRVASARHELRSLEEAVYGQGG